MARTRFGVRLPVSGPLANAQNIIRIGVLADELGFDALTTHDHITNSYTERYHNAGGVAESVEELDRQGLIVTNFYETMITLSVLAGKTKNVRLIPCAAVLPLRQPVLFGKQIVSLHELSGGRFVCCVALGRIKGSYDSMGVNYKLKAKIMKEHLQVLKLILSSEKQVSYQGHFLSFPPTEFFPKPSKKLPIWIAGYFNDKAYDRVAEFGEGFLPNGFPEAFAQGLPKLEEHLRARGRKLSDLEVGTQTFMCLMKDGEEAIRRSKHTVESFFHGPEWNTPDPNKPDQTMRQTMMEGIINNALVGSPSEVISRIDRFIAAGVQFFDIRQVNRTVEDVLQQLKLFSEEVMPSF